MKWISVYGNDHIEIRFIDTPNDIRKKRAERRGSFDETEWNRRAADDEEKFSKENLSGLFATGVNIRFIDNSAEESA